MSFFVPVPYYTLSELFPYLTVSVKLFSEKCQIFKTFIVIFLSLCLHFECLIIMRELLDRYLNIVPFMLICTLYICLTLSLVIFCMQYIGTVSFIF